MIRKRISKQKIQQFDMKLSELNVNITLINSMKPTLQTYIVYNSYCN